MRARDGNRAPVGRATATPDRGPLPLAVAFDGRGSTDPDGDAAHLRLGLRRRRDVGQAPPPRRPTRSPPPARTGAAAGPRPRAGTSDIADDDGLRGVPPTATITDAVAGTTWQVGDPLAFSGRGRRGGAPLPATG